jgi:hypothetical protein
MEPMGAAGHMAGRRRPTAVADPQLMVGGLPVTAADRMAGPLLPTEEVDQRHLTAEAVTPEHLAAADTRHPAVEATVAVVAAEVTAAAVAAATAAAGVTKSKVAVLGKSRPIWTAFLLAAKKHLSRSI